MNNEADCSYEKLTRPLFSERAAKIALEVGQYSVELLQQILKCNRAIAVENKIRYNDFFNEKHTLPALLAYYGQVYKCFKAKELNNKQWEYAAKHLWILSFLYGMLRPTDKIHTYRLEGNVKLESFEEKNLFAYWKPILTDILIEKVKADDGKLLYLATEEFQHLFDWKKIEQQLTVVLPKFMALKGDKLKNITVYAKSCRGAMARYVIENEIRSIEDLESFEYEGFKYKSKLCLKSEQNIEILYVKAE